MNSTCCRWFAIKFCPLLSSHATETATYIFPLTLYSFIPHYFVRFLITTVRFSFGLLPVSPSLLFRLSSLLSTRQCLVIISSLRNHLNFLFFRLCLRLLLNLFVHSFPFLSDLVSPHVFTLTFSFSQLLFLISPLLFDVQHSDLYISLSVLRHNFLKLSFHLRLIVIFFITFRSLLRAATFNPTTYTSSTSARVLLHDSPPTVNAL